MAVTSLAGSRSSRSMLGYIWRVSSRQQVALVLLAMLVFPLTMVPLELQRRIVNDAIGGDDLRWLLVLGGVYLAVVLLQSGLKFAFQVYRSRVGESVVRRMRRRIAGKTAEETPRSDHPEGEAISMAATEVERVGGFVGTSLSEPVLQGGILLSVLGYMVVVEPEVALVSLAVFLPQLAVVPLIQRVLNRRAARIVTSLRALGERIAEHDPGLAHASDQRDDIDRIYANRMSYHRLKFLLKLLSNLFNHLGPLSVLVVGGYYTIQGEATVGTVVAFISGFERMSDPARQLLAHYRLASETRVKYRLLVERLPL